jgi:hypothetical protein
MSSFIAICVNFQLFSLLAIRVKIPNYFYLNLIWNLMSERHVAPIHITIVAGQPEFESPSPNEKHKDFHFSM